MRGMMAVVRVLLVLLVVGVIANCADDPTAPERSVGNQAPTVFATAGDGNGLSITTDKDDYAPGDTVWFTGAGWTPGDSVDIVLTDDLLDSHEWTVGIGEDGTFRDSTYVVDTQDLGVTFTLTATSREHPQQTLTVVFTDGKVRVSAAVDGVTFLLKRTAFTGSGCQPAPGTALSNLTIGSSGTEVADATTGSWLLEAAAFATTPSTAAFVSWSGGTFTTPNPATPNIICVNATTSTQSFTVNYDAAPDLTVTKVFTSAGGKLSITIHPAIGGTYSITVHNGGNLITDGPITVQDVLPGGLGFVSGSGTGWNACSAVGQTVTCTRGNSADKKIAAGGDAPAITLNVSVSNTACPAVTNSATVSGGGEPAAKTANNQSAAVSTDVAGCPNPNSAPQVNAGGTYSGTEGSAIALNLATATDPDAADVLLYTWSSSSTNCGFSATNVLHPNITCSDNGSYTATLSVDDQHGHVVTNDATVNVSNVDPTATFNSPAGDVDEGSSFTLSLTGATDQSSVDAASLHYAFDCGGGYSATDYTSTNATSSATCNTATDGPATLGVKGRVIDKDGGFTEYTGSVGVKNLNPTATFEAPADVDEGSQFTLKLTNGDDPSPVDATSLHYAYDCGSGYSATTYAMAGTATSHSCNNAADGPATLSVKGKVFDKDGGSSEYTGSVTVKNVVPSITSVTANPSGQLMLGPSNQVSTTITVAFTDPAGTLDQPYSTSIDCDNGTTVTGSPTTYGSSSGVCTYTNLQVGFHTISATVTDNDGGTSAASTVQVQVIYNWNGFFQPVDNTNLNVAKAGSAIPVKFNLGGNQGLNIFYVGDPKAYPNSSQVNCDSHADEDTIEETVNAGGSSLTYDVTASQYIYVWKTDKLWAGKCRRLDVKLNDGTTHSATFKFKN